MAEKQHTFKARGARRIVAVTRRVEQLASDLIPATHDAIPTGSGGRWVKLTAEHQTELGVYSWTLMVWDAANRTFKVRDPAVTGSFNAMEVNGLRVAVGTVVRLFPAGDDTAKKRWHFFISPPPIEFGAIIIGNVPLEEDSEDACRWKYAWEPVELSGDWWEVVSASEPLGCTVEELEEDMGPPRYALNTEELVDSTRYVAGIDRQGDSYPENSNIRPIGGGGTDNTHKADKFVWMRVRSDQEGNPRYYFSAPNSHDGTC